MTFPVTETHRHSTLSNDRLKKSKPKPTNPIEEAIKAWFSTLPDDLLEAIQQSALLSTAPKRWVVYPPMLLLPSGSFEGNEWRECLSLDIRNAEENLWMRILQDVGKREGKGVLTHLAINSGIPLLNESLVNGTGKIGPDTRQGEEEVSISNQGHAAEHNILRTPTGLKIVHGDFGPSLSPTALPASQDFASAFWVSTRQNGITQTWAPRYTMFSRGNIKEKARILDFHVKGPEGRKRSKKQLQGEAAVDLYAGIGYFVFSYVKMGMGKVVGFEMNPWSVEGLRRGAVANGWSVRVVRSGEEWLPGDENVTVFVEDNAMALGRLDKLQHTWLGKVTHINCGLLPTSEQSWETALRLVSNDGWLHLHENVGVNEVQARRETIEGILQEYLSHSAKTAEVQAEHVELVKTFAPGVWHCVFDILITR
ncbi:hypothetical protein HYFRA_00002509 [Hymenoscyphus fraxineus]|uniref:tRNA wybutosine-synthesizing protein 2 n=1 Tax=Hymenoscyphus fraxineus TaxID=746836 RepID=A0A9N9L6E0_9HELO|nr:hypothetical protein HYFRA_00002509 [Hymenoscyphus fraxineus]